MILKTNVFNISTLRVEKIHAFFAPDTYASTTFASLKEKIFKY